MTESDYKTIPVMGRILNRDGFEISDQTIRRYVSNYEPFFDIRNIDGVKNISLKGSLRLIRRISEITNAGKRKKKVIEQLTAEKWPTYEKESAVPESGDDADRSCSDLIRQLTRIADNLDRLVLVAEAYTGIEKLPDTHRYTRN